MSAHYLHPSPPLSPSQFSTFINTDMLDDPASGGGAQQDASSIDLFKYYLDMNSMQSKAPPPPSSGMGIAPADTLAQPQPQPSALSLQDIEQFQAFFNSLNAASAGSTSASASASTSSLSPSAVSSAALSPGAFSAASAGSQQPLFAFAGASAGGPPSSASASGSEAALPPSAFSPALSSAGYFSGLTSGSETPIDPAVLQSLLGQAGSLQQPTTKRASPVPLAAASAPAASGKKRAVDEMELEDISEEEDDDDDDEEMPDDEDEEVLKPSKASRASKKASAPTPAKKAASASSTRKTAALSGKASAPIAGPTTLASDSAHHHPHALVPVPEWEDRPSKEEYDKLSSKEKRQLRNKISARNFRHRRKAHIDTLEDQLAQRDATIAALRGELGARAAENAGLRADVEMLKKNWEAIAKNVSAAAAAPAPPSPRAPLACKQELTPDEDDLYGAPGSLPALSPASSSASTAGDESTVSVATSAAFFQESAPAPAPAAAAARRTSARTAKPNLRKDVSGRPASSASAPFWSTSLGPSVNVHTTLVPELHLGPPAAALLAGKQPERASSAASAQLNMNPALNSLSAEQLGLLRGSLGALAPGSAPAALGAGAAAIAGKRAHDPVRDAFFDSNPFLLLRSDSLQDYRGQLYSKLANNYAGLQAGRPAPADKQHQHQSPPPAGLRPAFFAEDPATVPSGARPDELRTAGALATKTLFEKLGAAFWDAFAGSSAAPDARRRPLIPDARKVADVVSGRQRLALVPAAAAEPETEPRDSERELERMMDRLEIAKRQ